MFPNSKHVNFNTKTSYICTYKIKRTNQVKTEKLFGSCSIHKLYTDEKNQGIQHQTTNFEFLLNKMNKDEFGLYSLTSIFTPTGITTLTFLKVASCKHTSKTLKHQWPLRYL